MKTTNISKMKNQIPADILALNKVFQENGFELYLVGGCVRDLLLNETPHDWDMCTNATPNDMIHMCNHNAFSYHTIGAIYGTITIRQNNDWYEITTYRKEEKYMDGRHPNKIQFTDCLYDDLSRRDFTINAMALNPNTCELIDPFDGNTALQNKQLIAVGNAYDRIQEDALRMLRALRFAIKYHLTMQDELANAIHQKIENINQISKERITEEFRKIFNSGQPINSLFLEFSDLIAVIIPEIKPCIGFEQNNRYHKHNVYEHMLAVTDLCKSNKFEIKMASLLHDIGKPQAYVTDENGHGHFYGHPDISATICRTLLKNDFRLTTKETNRILELVEYHDMPIIESMKSVRRALTAHGEDFMRDWFFLKQADMDDHIYPNDRYLRTVNGLTAIMDKILENNMAFSLKDLNITGTILMNHFGLKQGKLIGTILQQLLADVIDEKLKNTEDALLNAAETIIKNQNMIRR